MSLLQREFYLDETKGPVRFRIIWNAIGYVPPQGNPRKIDMLNSEGVISRKLRTISEMSEMTGPDGTTKYQSRELKKGDQKLILEQAHIELIKKKIEEYPFWNPLAEDSPADVYYWLNTGSEAKDE